MMKTLFTLLVLISMSVSAQQHPGMDMNNAQMQAMMKNMQKMKTCMERIPPSEMQKMDKIGKKNEADIQALCQSGKRNKAKRELKN